MKASGANAAAGSNPLTKKVINMTHYAMLLNLDEANAHSLRRDELFHHILQGSILRKILLGHGQTEYTAMKNSLDAMLDNGLLEICECDGGVASILEGNTSGREAFRHLWLHDEKNGKRSRLYPLPGHTGAVAFCHKYDLSEEAAEELSLLLNALIDLNNKE